MGLLASVQAGRGGRVESRHRGGGVAPGWSPGVSLSGLLAEPVGGAGILGEPWSKGGPGDGVSEEVRGSGGRAGLDVGEGGPAEGARVGTCEAGAVRVPCKWASARPWRLLGCCCWAASGWPCRSGQSRAARWRLRVGKHRFKAVGRALRAQPREAKILTEACADGPRPWSRVGGWVRACGGAAPQPSLGVRFQLLSGRRRVDHQPCGTPRSSTVLPSFSRSLVRRPSAGGSR